MAPNPSLNQLFAALNAAPHPDMGTAYFAHVGSHLALARTIPPAWFPKTSAATEAQIGGLIANLHSLTTVDWGAADIRLESDRLFQYASPGSSAPHVR